MARVIEMPKLSDTMEEGGIANWLKKEGDKIKEGEALVEIETDKATQEYESPEEGVLLKILVPSGKTVALRTPIAVVGAAGETVDVAALGAPKAAAPVAAAAPAAPVAVAPKTPSPLTPPVALAAAPTATGRVRASPLARKVAAERGVDVAQIHGSGPAGRIIMRDVRSAESSPAVQSLGATPAISSTAPGTAINVSMMRKTIAKRLTAAKNDAPHFYLTVSAHVGKLEAWRLSLNDSAAKGAKGGSTPVKVSLNDALILACARALRLHPMVNASWQGETIVLHEDSHIAVAVALPEGLVTPVIRRADAMGVREIAAASRELATKAKEGGLSNDAFSGGTFTISNLGMFGIEAFTAIINPPQAAILAVGAAAQVPWVDEHGRVAAQLRMTMTLSCDHRVVDGATGAKFLQTLVSYLEDPLQMLA